MILILGGIHEAFEIARRCAEKGWAVTLSVATDLGLQLYRSEQFRVIKERFTEEGLATYLRRNGISVLLDITHPHAREISKVARGAAGRARIPLFRFLRKSGNLSLETVRKETIGEEYEAFSDFLKAHRHSDKRYFFTGVKHISQIYEVFSKEQCFFRIMPSMYSFEEVRKYDVPMDRIIAVKSPVSPELNRCLFREFRIDYFVFKNSGQGSAYENNLRSLEGTDVIPVLIARREEETTPTEAREGIFHRTTETEEEIIRLVELYLTEENYGKI